MGGREKTTLISKQVRGQVCCVTGRYGRERENNLDQQTGERAGVLCNKVVSRGDAVKASLCLLLMLQ